MSKDTVKISKAKGRPMLTWVGKRPLTQVKVYPAQEIETFAVEGQAADADWSDWPDGYPQGGLLFHGDNKDVLAHLLAKGFRGKVKLIYIDPPFDSGADYVRKVQLRGATGSTKIDGEEYTLGEQVQYEDIWANDNYLQFMYERLLMLKELLAEDGSIYLHCDPRRSAYLRIVMDEVFGSEHFQNELVWERTNAHNMPTKTFGRAHDVILLYSKSNEFVFNKTYVPYGDAQLSRYKEGDDGRLYTGRDLTFSTANEKRQFTWRGVKPPANRSWGYSEAELEDLWQQGRILKKTDGSPRLDGLKVYLDETKGKPLTSIWNDISRIGNTAGERTEYPTQKPEELLERMLEASSVVGDLILDCFAGSGTTAVAAQKLGRRWIGCDINKGAIQTTAKRLHQLMRERAEDQKAKPQGKLLVDDDNAEPQPAQLSFSTWRVNDYDLQIQHNEAVALACDYLGVTRTRADSYFDGTLGNRLVRVVPFNHPLTPMDLEDLRAELERRPEEERDITLISLGVELNARAALEDYNRNRPINKIHLIELRTDPKYGGFFEHQPLTVAASVERDGDELVVRINDVFSPGIVQRLNLEQGIFRAQVEDWRVVVDCILIDTDHDGEVFNVALSDIPPRKQDLVDGEYRLPAPREGANVAIKVIDMLGEEAVVVKPV